MAFLVLCVAMSDRKHHFEGCQVSKVHKVQGFSFRQRGEGVIWACHMYLGYEKWLNFKHSFGGDGHPQVEKVSADSFF